MNYVDAICEAKVGQKVKRRKPSTVSVVKERVTVARLDEVDYNANDWVLVVPRKGVVTSLDGLLKSSVGDTVRITSLAGKKVNGVVVAVYSR